MAGACYKFVRGCLGMVEFEISIDRLLIGSLCILIYPILFYSMVPSRSFVVLFCTHV